MTKRSNSLQRTIEGGVRFFRGGASLDHHAAGSRMHGNICAQRPAFASEHDGGVKGALKILGDGATQMLLDMPAKGVANINILPLTEISMVWVD